jgi:hypothetical protein
VCIAGEADGIEMEDYFVVDLTLLGCLACLALVLGGLLLSLNVQLWRMARLGSRELERRQLWASRVEAQINRIVERWSRWEAREGIEQRGERQREARGRRSGSVAVAGRFEEILEEHAC